MEGPWFVLIGKKRYGPYTLDVLRSYVKNGRLRPDMLVWKKGLAEWIAASKDGDLATLFSVPARALTATATEAPDMTESKVVEPGTPEAPADETKVDEPADDIKADEIDLKTGEAPAEEPAEEKPEEPAEEKVEEESAPEAEAPKEEEKEEEKPKRRSKLLERLGEQAEKTAGAGFPLKITMTVILVGAALGVALLFVIIGLGADMPAMVTLGIFLAIAARILQAELHHADRAKPATPHEAAARDKSESESA